LKETTKSAPALMPAAAAAAPRVNRFAADAAKNALAAGKRK